MTTARSARSTSTLASACGSSRRRSRSEGASRRPTAASASPAGVTGSCVRSTLSTGKVLWTFQTGHQIASGASVFSVGSKEYMAITVGGTPTSSSGGTATELQVFALGGSSSQSPPPPLPRALQSISHRKLRSHVARPAVAAAQGFGTIPTQGGLVVRLWEANSSNVAGVGGRVLLNGAPVAGALVSLDGYTVPQATAKDGSFKTDVDITIPLRRVVRVVGVAHTHRARPCAQRGRA